MWTILEVVNSRALIWEVALYIRQGSEQFSTPLVEEIRNKIMAASKQCFVILDSVCERHRADEWVKILSV